MEDLGRMQNQSLDQAIRHATMMTLSRDSDECLKCQHHDYCDEKRMVACALTKMTDKQMSIAQPSIQLNMNQVSNLIFNDHKEIKIQIEPQISVEDIENELIKRLRLGCHFRKDW